jgi:hypothetical protein
MVVWVTADYASGRTVGPTQLLNQPVEVACPGVKRLESEAAHSHPPNTKVKNAWNYAPTSASVLKTWCPNLKTYSDIPTKTTTKYVLLVGQLIERPLLCFVFH